MGTTVIPFNDQNGLKEIEKIANDPILGKNIKNPFRVPLPKDAKGLHRISYISEGLDVNEFSTLGTNTEVIFKIGNREIYRTQNTTVLGGRTSLLENAFGLTPILSQHLTLNEIIGIDHPKTEDVIMKRLNGVSRQADYFMVGNGASSLDVPGVVYSPKNYETRLYNAIPFRFVPETTDLTENEKADYRLRKSDIEIGGNRYIAYFAKKFEPGVLKLEYGDDTYIPNLSPVAGDHSVPVQETNEADHPLSGGSVLCYIEFTLSIEANEMKEYFQVIDGNIDRASMSEAGIILGADLPLSSSEPDGPKELAGAELFSKVTSKPFYLDSEGTSRTIVYRIYAK
jgi:hypothetical protein